jgi:hypothetical protein
VGGLGGLRGDRVGLQGEGLLDGFGEGDREKVGLRVEVDP